jgi:putative endonuclease
MIYFAYLLKSISPGINKTYAGYSVNVEKRLDKHNSNTGAKSTKGYKWKIIFKKKFETRSEAMKFEYKLKKDKILRKKIINNFVK